MPTLHERVVNFVSDQVGVSPARIKPDTTLLGDLGVAGEDGSLLLEDFGRAFSVDMGRCDPGRHFGDEGCGPLAPLYWLIVAFRKGSREERVGLQAVRIADLVRSAELGIWSLATPTLPSTPAPPA